jgi:hypothetical protein
MARPDSTPTDQAAIGQARRKRTDAAAEQPAHPFQAGLRTVVAASAAPYGYTLAIWSSGAVLLAARGKPTVGEVFLFIAGALSAFGILGAFIMARVSEQTTSYRGRERMIAGAFDWIAVGAAVGAAALIAQIASWVAWPLAAFAASALYFSAFGLQLAFVALTRRTVTR